MYNAIAISVTDHDTNAALYNGEKVRYCKFERHIGHKHNAPYDFNAVKQYISEIFAINLNELNEIVLDVGKSFVDTYITHNADMQADWQEMVAEKSTTCCFEANAQLKESLGLTTNVYIISHHYVHSLSGWMLPNNVPDVSIVIDGAGDMRSWSVYKGDKIISTGNYDHGTIGECMANMVSYLKLPTANEAVVDCVGKLTNLHSYGKLDFKFLEILRQYGMDNIRTIFSPDLWEGYKKDKLLADLTHLDWLRTVHVRVGELLVEFFSQFTNQDETIFYSGGVAQNIVWNTQLKLKFPKLVISPHAGNDGNSLGAIEWLRRKNHLPLIEWDEFPYSQADTAPDSVPDSSTIGLAASLLANGKIIAWYQGHSEIGPRSLGNRSILMDPRLSADRLNAIKNKPPYGLFGASVLREHANTYFFQPEFNEYMNYSGTVRKTDLNLGSVSHIDTTCRLQVVDDKNPVFKDLLNQFCALTGCPVLVNTSLNVAGKSIAGTPEAAMEIFNTTDIDAIFIGNEYFLKSM